jgi:nicotinamidase-related amidase
MANIQFKGRYYRLYPAEKYLGLTEEMFELDPAETALIVCDVYGAAFDEETKWEGLDLSYLFQDEAEIIRHHIRPAVDAARTLKLPIIYLNNSAPVIGLRQSAFGRQRHVHVNAWLDDLFGEDNVDPLEYHYGTGTEIKLAPVIAPKPGDHFIRKWVYSGFFDTRLDSLLKNLHIKNLVCTGFALEFCLLGTVLDALYRNYDVFLLRDCTLAVDLPGEVETRSFTKRMILWFENAIGVTTTSEDWIAACRALKE